MIIDRFENNYVICELDAETFTQVPRALLPQNAKEGDVIVLENGRYFIDLEATAKRRARIRGKMDLLFRRGQPPPSKDH